MEDVVCDYIGVGDSSESLMTQIRFSRRNKKQSRDLCNSGQKAFAYVVRAVFHGGNLESQTF